MGEDILTQNQERYISARIEGKSQRQAYIAAYPNAKNWKPSTVDSKASTLEANEKVRKRLCALKDKAQERALISRAKTLQRIERLAELSAESIEQSFTEGGKIDYSASQALINASKELLPHTEEKAEGGAAFVADFGLLIAPAFLEPHRRIHEQSQADYWLGGGRGSMKSSFASLELVHYIETHPEQHALVLMKHRTNLRDAAYSQVIWAIEKLGLSEKYSTPASTLRIKRKGTGQLIIFRGCDDASKIKSIKPPFGHIGFAWYEEADMFQGMAEIRKVNQSLTRGGADCVRLYTYNPPRSVNCWLNEYTQTRRAGGLPVFESNYTQAPKEWLGEQFFADAEELRRIDEKAYRHEYLGEPVGQGLEVFDPERVVFREITDAEIAQFDNLKAGQDFGWYPDPWAFTVSEWQQAGRVLLTFRECGGNKLQPKEQAAQIKAALTINGEPLYLPVLSDDADPQTIAAQREEGINAKAAGKGGLRAASYKFIQSATWVIDPARCPRLAKEVREQQYETTKDGEVLNVIPDGNDHFIDATRYALMRNVAQARTAYREY